MSRRKKSQRIIEQLRRKFPGVWAYRPYPEEDYLHEDGWTVRAYAVPAPKYDGDDDSYTTEWRRTDTNEVVLTRPLFLGGSLLSNPLWDGR